MTAVEARLPRYATLDLSSREIAEQYFLPRRDKRPKAAGSRGEEQRRAAGGRRGARSARGEPADADVARDETRRARCCSSSPTQKILRAVYSERQLEEVLADFWFNHFNVFAGKGADAASAHRVRARRDPPARARHFRDLLGATAKSPAMLFYLDNWLSADPNGRDGRGGRRLGRGAAVAAAPARPRSATERTRRRASTRTTRAS